MSLKPSPEPVSPGPEVTSNRWWLICLTIICVAFGVRLLQWQNNFLTLDKNMTGLTARYKEEAQFLLNGDLTSFVKGSRSKPDTMILSHPPAYPLVIATVYKLSGNSDRALRLFQIACEALAAVLVFLIAARLIPRSAAVLAALLAAVAPQLAFRSLVLLPDSLTALPILAAILLIMKAVDDGSARKMMLAGGLIGVSCWFRADTVLLPLFLCATLPLLFPRGQRRRQALALIGGATIVIAPITIRNVLVFHSFVPVALGTGITLSEGIGDYDVEQRFGLSATDHGTCLQEAEWAGRPDYAAELYRPDGIERDRGRTARALSVIRAEPAWFAGTMVRRVGTMLTYEQAPIISVEPTVSHSLEITKDKPLVWSGSQQELLSEPQVLSVRPNFDYVLTIPVKIQQGKASIVVKGVDRPRILASAALPDSLERAPYTQAYAPSVQIPFVSTNVDKVQLEIANVESNGILDIGHVQLHELGPAAYLWTRYPRMLVKTFQKLFVTSYFLPLTILGVVLLAVQRRKIALAVILAVPLYYLVSHAPLHFEHRYMLPAYFFWFILVGLSLYWLGLTFVRFVIQIRRRLSSS